VLLRNQLKMVGVEMWVKIYSPVVEGIEVVKRAERRARRARLYYMRYVLFYLNGMGWDGRGGGILGLWEWGKGLIRDT
jgi:hypothetical protein